MRDYLDYVNALTAAMREAASVSAPQPSQAAGAAAPDAPVALILSPHPDDEMIVGALPLRLLREAGMRVVNLAVTLGSNRARRPGRLAELRNACAHAGFALEIVGREGLDGVLPELALDPDALAAAAKPVADMLRQLRPAAVFLPHALDANRTHKGVHLVGTEAMKLARITCDVFETEFWAPMAHPNLVVESSEEDVAMLVSALALHTGEVSRNPYHLRLPAWMIDNVRRGAELVGTQGGAAPDFTFATLYRHFRMTDGRPNEEAVDSQFLSRQGSSSALLIKNG